VWLNVAIPNISCDKLVRKYSAFIEYAQGLAGILIYVSMSIIGFLQVISIPGIDSGGLRFTSSLA
jgi:hypothetical protein